MNTYGSKDVRKKVNHYYIAVTYCRPKMTKLLAFVMVFKKRTAHIKENGNEEPSENADSTTHA